MREKKFLLLNVVFLAAKISKVQSSSLYSESTTMTDWWTDKGRYRAAKKLQCDILPVMIFSQFLNLIQVLKTRTGGLVFFSVFGWVGFFLSSSSWSRVPRHGRLVWLVVVGGPVMIHADGGVMFSLADVVINMPLPPSKMMMPMTKISSDVGQ